ncbi:MAG: NAD-dependent epimerase/dehydratase family protein [Nitrosomonadales bacterium]|nr:NAD-dependent epimerase/dehydratase family protein [Nitrosomonadales bacterium]
MKILVLGGNGFIGTHILDELLDAGHEVRVFDRSHEVWRKPLPSVRYYLGDFANTPLLAEAMQGIDVVIHLISTTVPSTSNLDPIADIQSNLENSVRLFQLMRSANVERIVYLSSGGTVYGIPSILPVPETHPLNPICSYGIVKVAIEKYLGMFEYLYGLKPLIVRASNPFGPRQGHQGVQGVVSTFMHKILSDEKITIWGDGSTKRDYLYVTDLARMCRIAAESNLTGVVNAGSGRGLNLVELVQMIETATGKGADIEYIAARSYDVPEIVLNIEKARTLLGWSPGISMQKGLSLQFGWMAQDMKKNQI